jgi:hypothetical protein
MTTAAPVIAGELGLVLKPTLLQARRTAVVIAYES